MIEFITFLVPPLLIFLARIIDVTIGTVKIIFISRGYKAISAGLAFVEVLIFLVAITQIMQNLDNPIYYIAFAAGFSAGTYIGIYIEEKIAVGIMMIRVITRNESESLIEDLKSKKFRLTIVDAQDNKGPVKVIYSIVKRRNVKTMINSINKFGPASFYSIEDIRSIKRDFIPPKHPFYKINQMSFLQSFIKRK